MIMSLVFSIAYAFAFAYAYACAYVLVGTNLYSQTFNNPDNIAVHCLSGAL